MISTPLRCFSESRCWDVSTLEVENMPTDQKISLPLSSHSLDYISDDKKMNFDCSDYFSHTTVEIQNGVISDIVGLIKGCNELHDQTGYWGCYVEGLEYRQDTCTIEVHFGS